MSTPVGQPFWHQLLHSPAGGPAGLDLGLLVLRVGFGGLLALHGLDKVLNYAERAASFPDPLGIGQANSLHGAIVCELVFSLLVLVGVFTRLSTIPVIFNMIVATSVTWEGRQFFLPAPGAREGALVFLIPFVAILCAGPGRFSVDGWIQPPNPSTSGKP